MNDSKSRTGANLIPDPERAPLIGKAFELMATGTYQKTQVLQIVTEAGLRTRKGEKLSVQTFEETLKKPVYCGLIMASFLTEPVRGLHEPLISEELFRNVQSILSGRRLSVAPKGRHNPHLPLKHFVRCDGCGTPLTGGMVTGKNRNKKFGYYWCRRPECRAVMVRREKLEDLFLDHLRRLRPEERTVSEFPRIAEQVWAEVQGNAKETAKKISAQLEDRKRLKSELLRAKLRGEVSQADYVQANAELDSEIVSLEQSLNATYTDDIEKEAFLRFGKAMLLDVATAWHIAEPEQEIGVQNLLFQTGLRYSQESGDFKHLNPCLFSVMEEMRDKNWWLASPAGFEPAFTP